MPAIRGGGVCASLPLRNSIRPSTRSAGRSCDDEIREILGPTVTRCETQYAGWPCLQRAGRGTGSPCVRTYSPGGTPSSVNRPRAVAHARDGLEADVVRAAGRADVMTSVIASPTSRMVVGGGADPSGVTRRPETRTAGTGRSAIVTSVRSSPLRP